MGRSCDKVYEPSLKLSPYLFNVKKFQARPLFRAKFTEDNMTFEELGTLYFLNLMLN